MTSCNSGLADPPSTATMTSPGQQLNDMQRAVLNVLEDATADRLRAEAAARAALESST